MRIEVSSYNGTVWVKVFGRSENSPLLYDALKDIDPVPNLVVDFTRAEGVDSSTLATLCELVERGGFPRINVLGDKEGQLREKARVYKLEEVRSLYFV